MTSVAMETIAFKSTAVSFPFSACFIICIFSACHALLCFAICIYKIYILNDYAIDTLSTFPAHKYIPLGLLRTLSFSVIFICISRDIPGSLLVILLQISVPISILISRFVSSLPYTTISKAHWTAIILVFVGIAFGFVSSFMGRLGANYVDYKHDNVTLNAWWYMLIVLCSCLMQSLFILYQEMKLKRLPHFEQCPSELRHAFVSLFQCVFSFLFTPITIYLQDPYRHFWDDWCSFLHKGFLCLFTTSVDESMYCPNSNTSTAVQFTAWTVTAVLTLAMTNYVSRNVTPLVSRFCVLFGLLLSFIGFQTGFPASLWFVAASAHNHRDYFDECLLLAMLCSFVGSFMLLIDFNPQRPHTLLDAIQFEQLNYSQHIREQLLHLQQQHQSLTKSQSQIIVDVDEVDDDEADHSDCDVHHDAHDEEECVPSKLQRTVSSSSSRSRLSYNRRRHSSESSDYVCYLLMEQQKEIIQQEYQSKLQEYQRAERERSRSFHEEFYAPSRSPPQPRPKHYKKMKPKKKKKRAMSERDLHNAENRKMLHLQKHQPQQDMREYEDNLNSYASNVQFQTSHFYINNPLMMQKSSNQ